MGGDFLVEVYYYIPAGEVVDAVECGMKLSKWFDKEVEIEGYKRKCISALLNPKDDMEKFNSEHLKCLKLEVATNYCFIAEKYFYEIGLNNPEIIDIYTKSIVPVKKYIFGCYRLPECLVTSTIIGGQIKVMNKRIDSPVLVNSSEELYVNNIIESYREKHDDFNDTMLYYFYCKLFATKKLNRVEDSEKKIAVFFDKISEKAFAIKIPDIDRY
jgi:hypothetical protein